jgi:hypothetical protein
LLTGEYFSLEKHNLSQKSLKIAHAAEFLNDQGKETALDMVEALQRKFPLDSSALSNNA